MHSELLSLRGLPAQQQPEWPDQEKTRQVVRELAALPPLVDPADTAALRGHLARAAAGGLHIVQAGDCAEGWEDCTPAAVSRKAGLLDALAGTVRMTTDKPVLRAGRMAGQFGKPRSAPTETVGGRELPVYRGHMVNSPEPDPELRRPDAHRMLTGYRAAAEAVRHLGRPGTGSGRADAPVWTSHEALLLDYETAMLRRGPDGTLLLSSTHWPWIGERTRQVDGAHVALLAAVANPVACKVGPGMTVAELTALCERLDPRREPGRLTLIVRMGAETVGQKLPPLVAAVREAGHPVVWLCDPMHGNTVKCPGGLKTRFVDTVIREVVDFQSAVSESGGRAAGLHLEATADEVTECVRNETRVDEVGSKYTSLCDPRLNPRQAVAVASAWRG